MAQPEVTIRTTNPDGASADIASLCRSITWSGDYRNAARTFSFSPVTSAGDTHLPTAPTKLGGSVQFSVDGTLLMDAYSLTRSRDSLGTTIDVIAYDRGIYLTRNNKTLAVNNQTPEAVTASLASEFGIQTGSIAATGVKLKRNFIGVSLYKIIMTLYSLAAEQTSKKYAIRFSGAALEVVEVKQSSTSIQLKPGSNLLSLNAKEDASKIINSVAIYDDEYKQTGIQQDAASAALYGMMQQAVKASQHDDPVAYAKKLLRENGMRTTITANCIGNAKLVTGNTAVVEEPVTGTYGLFWIVSDTHTWRRNIYQTKVTLSLEELMDSQSAGSVPMK